jgi:hypothetical protein
LKSSSSCRVEHQLMFNSTSDDAKVRFEALISGVWHQLDMNSTSTEHHLMFS